MKTAAVWVLLAAIGSAQAQSVVELFSDDFSRFPPGRLSAPFGELNPAIQEYHYFAHRGVPLEPWANAIGYLDAWVAGDEDGKPYLEQHLTPENRWMNTKVFTPVFITGDPELFDVTVEASVKPLATTDFAGVVFRYHTSRHHYVFCLTGGNKARLAVRLPIETAFRTAAWKELGLADFEYDTTKWYRLKVENEGAKIRAYIDGKLILSAEDSELSKGKVGVAANIPAKFTDFRITCTQAVKDEILQRRANRVQAEEKEQAANPKPKLWKKFETPKFGAGRNVRFGDLDGDGVPDMLIAQNVPKVDSGNFVEITCLTAVTLEGKVLWQVGRPDPRNGLLTADCPFQIHDVDGDGKNDVVMVKDFKVHILDGATGKVKKSALMPKVPEEYAKKNSPFELKERPHELNLGDSILFVNFSGDAHRREIVLKDRYRYFWVLDRELKTLWTGHGMLGHYPYPFADGSGKDKLCIGYSMWDHTGKLMWSRDLEMKDHADSVALANLSPDPAAAPKAWYSCSDEGFLLLDRDGNKLKHHRIGHAQTACIGKFRPDVPGLQYACVNFWKNPGIVTVLDHEGNILSQDEPIHSGSVLLPVNWTGDGREFILLDGAARGQGMVDGKMRRVVAFPDDGHPDLTAAVMDLTGDARDEIILWDQNRVWIYTQDRPFVGAKVYAPKRNPEFNDGNYRCTVSLPK